MAGPDNSERKYLTLGAENSKKRQVILLDEDDKYILTEEGYSRFIEYRDEYRDSMNQEGSTMKTIVKHPELIVFFKLASHDGEQDVLTALAPEDINDISHIIKFFQILSIKGIKIFCHNVVVRDEMLNIFIDIHRERAAFSALFQTDIDAHDFAELGNKWQCIYREVLFADLSSPIITNAESRTFLVANFPNDVDSEYLINFFQEPDVLDAICGDLDFSKILKKLPELERLNFCLSDVGKSAFMKICKCSEHILNVLDTIPLESRCQLLNDSNILDFVSDKVHVLATLKNYLLKLPVLARYTFFLKLKGLHYIRPELHGLEIINDFLQAFAPKDKYRLGTLLVLCNYYKFAQYFKPKAMRINELTSSMLASIITEIPIEQLNIVDSDNRNPLHVAAEMGFTEIAWALLLRGVNPYILERGFWGKSPFDIAQKQTAMHGVLGLLDPKIFSLSIVKRFRLLLVKNKVAGDSELSQINTGTYHDAFGVLAKYKKCENSNIIIAIKLHLLLLNFFRKQALSDNAKKWYEYAENIQRILFSEYNWHIIKNKLPQSDDDYLLNLVDEEELFSDVSYSPDANSNAIAKPNTTLS